MAEELLPRSVVVEFLARYGYLDTDPHGGNADARDVVSPGVLEEAIAEYQLFNGLPDTGEVDPRTAHLMLAPRCGLPDVIPTPRAGVCKWPEPRVSYATSIRLPQLSEADVVRAFDTAAAQWNAVCGIQLFRVQSTGANIFSRSGTGQQNQLDGRGGTLAWSELPCSNNMGQRIRQMYDEAENWSFNMAVAVMCHELGHAIGMEHINSGNLLAPYYNPQILKPQSGDIQVVRRLYGAPTAPPPSPPPPPPPPPVDPGVIDISGLIYINGLPYTLVRRT